MIDASGLFVMPGGIDSHVHIAQPSGDGIVMADDFDSGTLSAAIGGNTTICLLHAGKGADASGGAENLPRQGRRRVPRIDSFHLVITDPTA
jgi:dihydropyrimidinase